MQIRPSSALPWLVAAATVLVLEAPAHAQPPPATGTGATAAPAAAPEAAPEEADKDANRAIYLSGDFGFVRHDLGAFSDNLAFDERKANGYLAGLGVGYRHKMLRFGGRFRSATTTEFSLWSIMAEVGIGLPFRPLTPIIFLHAGYMFDTGVERGAIASSLPAGSLVTPNVELDGLMIGAEATLAYWVTKFLRVGPYLGLDLTFLHRGQPPVPPSLFPVPAETRTNALFGDSGSGVGYTINLGIRVTGDVAF